MKRRTTLMTAGAVTAAVALGAGTLVIAASDHDAPAERRNDLPPATTKITRTDLVQSKTVDGHLDYAQRRTVKSPVEGTVTKAAEEGRTVRTGQRLYERDARPVILMYGPTPAFRALKAGDRGPDVLQLERNLRDLGFGASLYIDTRYDKGTEAAVKSWQRSLGIENPDGRVGRGDIVFQPGTVRVVSADAALADQIGPDKAVLTVASTRPVVRAPLDQGETSLTRPGTKVELTLPSGRTATGKVAGTVRPEAPEGSAAPSQEGITVEITFDHPRTALATEDPKATTSVKFISESHKNVLTVPVEAVVALRGENGGYGLEVVQGRTTRMVRVTTGMTADGRIEVSGSGLSDGMTVGVAKQ
ncbi:MULTISPECIES: efflux RND transporter periplasmic adaptor subunit [Streptomyces]|uniref:Peptidoglycan-binding protein n=1 Tax=Streptomyces siderophoricus TaxID=2802281 RepID=A0ABS1MZV3_9ACTN|nr:peptidoglycan-binding protein [Streptomyces sp. 9-7]MBL1093254.1 peptidoglycan-binding protein [Streptomyces sp. 9-7]